MQLIDSRANCHGIEVRLEHVERRHVLRAYRLGRPVARASVSATRLGGRCVIEDETLSRDARRAVEGALEEGLRVYRDGRGLCEAA